MIFCIRHLKQLGMHWTLQPMVASSLLCQEARQVRPGDHDHKWWWWWLWLWQWIVFQYDLSTIHPIFRTFQYPISIYWIQYPLSLQYSGHPGKGGDPNDQCSWPEVHILPWYYYHYYFLYIYHYNLYDYMNYIIKSLKICMFISLKICMIIWTLMKRFTATHGIKAKKGEQKLFLWVEIELDGNYWWCIKQNINRMNMVMKYF